MAQGSSRNDPRWNLRNCKPLEPLIDRHSYKIEPAIPHIYVDISSISKCCSITCRECCNTQATCEPPSAGRRSRANRDPERCFGRRDRRGKDCRAKPIGPCYRIMTAVNLRDLHLRPLAQFCMDEFISLPWEIDRLYNRAKRIAVTALLF